MRGVTFAILIKSQLIHAQEEVTRRLMVTANTNQESGPSAVGMTLHVRDFEKYFH